LNQLKDRKDTPFQRCILKRIVPEGDGPDNHRAGVRYLDAPPVVVGSRNWIIPAHEMEQYFFPQPEWIVDAIHEKILLLKDTFRITISLLKSLLH